MLCLYSFSSFGIPKKVALDDYPLFSHRISSANATLSLQFAVTTTIEKNERVHSTSFSARVKLEMFTILGIEMSLLIIHCMFNRFLYRLQTPKCIKMCCSQRTQKSSMLGSGKGTQGKEVVFVPDPGRWNTFAA